MNILKLNSVEEIKQYNTLIGYFEVDGRFYTTCPNCGNPIALDRHVTRVDLLRDNDTMERLEFCSADCAWEYQLDEYDPAISFTHPFFIEDKNEYLLYYFNSKANAEKKLKELNSSDYKLIDLEEIIYAKDLLYELRKLDVTHLRNGNADCKRLEEIIQEVDETLLENILLDENFYDFDEKEKATFPTFEDWVEECDSTNNQIVSRIKEKLAEKADSKYLRNVNKFY